MEIYNLKSSDLLLNYTDFKELIKQVRVRLSVIDLTWLVKWEMLDLALSPMDDDERRFMRYGHHLGWHAFQQSVQRTDGTCPHLKVDFQYICMRCGDVVDAIRR